MSYTVGMDAICLRSGPRLAHTEYCAHDTLTRQVERESGRRFIDAWDFDFVWSTNDGPVPWSERGRTTDMGHAEYMEGGVDRREPKPSPFTSAEDVWAFDAVAEYGLPDTKELVEYYQRHYESGQTDHPEQVFPGGYYKTIVSGAIDAFGWDMLLQAAADQTQFEDVLDSIFRLALHHYEAWARTSVKAFICHDDMVWSQGPFVHPDFYRSVIFPRYAELWTVLRKAGIKVLYCSDGDWSMFLDDIVEAGADGFIFEPMVPLDTVVERYGQSHCIMGSHVDCRTMTYGSQDDIRREIDRTLPLARECPGFVFAVGNHIPANVPVENARFYIDYLRENWHR
jgi:uroporphyrinogen decarboxylase